MVHRSALCATLVAWLLACLTGCGTPDSGTRVEGPAPTRIRWTGPVYVLDWRSRPRQRPDLMDLTEITVLDQLVWKNWGSPKAFVTGVVIDLPCLSGCPHETLPSYPVTIVFSGLTKRRYAAYYSWAAVTPVHRPAPDWAEDVHRVRLRVPTA
ncbi:hypothetical protein ACWD4G_44805 [Streptomyces sp. NPDC002643]